MKKPHIKDQFQFPTIIQDHSTGDWETVIGRRNLLTTSEAVISGLCANPAIVNFENGYEYKWLAAEAVEIAKALLEEVKRNES